MLQEWQVPVAVNFHIEEEMERMKKHGRSVRRVIQQSEQKAELARHKDVLHNVPGHTELVEHHIETRDAEPVQLPAYWLPHAHRETVCQDLQEMLESVVIEPTTSKWAAPMVLVPKKAGSLRICVDYRWLNSVLSLS